MKELRKLIAKGGTMKKLLVAAILPLLAVVFVESSINAPTAQAEPAVGDHVASVTFSVDCSISVGIAFDGTNLWYSCWDKGELYRANPLTGVVTGTWMIASGLGALSYDTTRNAIWAGAGSDEVWRIDLDASKNVIGSTLVFHTGDFCGLDDGLAFDARNVADPSDDVIYYSDDCWTVTIDVYNLSGVKVESFPVPAGFGAHNSGLAVGGQLLYIVDMFNNTTYAIDKTTKVVQFTFSTAVVADPNFHPEDQECDTNTFAGQGKHVTWSKEAYSPARAHAFEIPFGSCGIGGQPEEPKPPKIEAPVDIKPQSCPNPLNVNDKGVLPVAILGTATFDVNQIDLTTVKSEGVSPLRSAIGDVATPFAPFVGKELATDCTTAGADGFIDLTLKFDNQAIVAALGPVTDKEVRALKITGNLKPEFGGTSIVGEDVVVILKKK